MDYTLTTPCGNCPFRTDCLEGWLGEARAEEIIQSIVDQQATFSCHKLNDFDDEGETVEGPKAQHCAGAMILLEKIERPNQMMRIAERLGMYDRTKLKMDAPVFDDESEFIEHHTEY